MLSFTGIADRNARFVEKIQLMDVEYWRMFVEQFRSNVDDEDLGWRCEYFGKMMRGASMTYSYTNNEELYRVLTNAAEDMLTAQDDLGRFSTYSVEKEFNGWDMWGRKYVLLGFLHYFDICRDEELKSRIISALEKHLDYIVEHVGHGKKEISETSSHWLCINSASILEPVVRMYRLLGHERYLRFAEYIVDYLYNGKPNIFKLALEDELYPYQYPVVKAYEMMSCFEGLLEYYEVTKEEKWFKAVENFVERVRLSDITVIGCSGCKHELFNHASATQTDSDYKGLMQETCVTVTWMKICNRLLELTVDSKYADEIERSAYNALYGAVNTFQKSNAKGEQFMFDSYSPLFLGVRSRDVGGYKNISESKYYGCCVAIGAHGTALVPLTAVRTCENSITVNYYEKGTAYVGDFELEFDTEYPTDGSVKITVNKAPCGISSIKLRIPYFTNSKANIKVNGETVQVSSGYTEISREWLSGDVIELKFDMNPRILHPEGVDGKPHTKAFLCVMYGPLVLARDKRLGEVGTTVPDADTLEFALCTKDEFPCELMATVSLGDKVFKMIDYMSAGKTWDMQSQMEAWIPTNNLECTPKID